MHSLSGIPVKRLVKLMLASFCRHGRIFKDLAMPLSSKTGKTFPILTYHRVLPSADAPEVFSSSEIVVSEETFQRQMKILKDACTVVRLEDFPSMKAAGALPHNAVAVTFDDGWEDNYRHAFPLLKEYNIPATIFLPVEFLGTDQGFWQERLRFYLSALRDKRHEKDLLRSIHSRLPASVGDLFPRRFSGKAILTFVERMKEVKAGERDRAVSIVASFFPREKMSADAHRFLSWEQVRQMAASGVRFGSHGMSHGMLTGLEALTCRAELAESKREIERILGAPVVSVAYPNGAYDEQVLRCAHESGYTVGVGTKSGINTLKSDPLCLKRINVSEKRFQGIHGEFSADLFLGYLYGCLR